VFPRQRLGDAPNGLSLQCSTAVPDGNRFQNPSKHEGQYLRTSDSHSTYTRFCGILAHWQRMHLRDCFIIGNSQGDISGQSAFAAQKMA
jgi:hypothetical protein